MLIYNYMCLNRGANDWPIYCQLVLLAFAKADGYFRENLIRVPSAATFIVLEMDRGDNWTSHLTFYTTNKNTPKFREFKVVSMHRWCEKNKKHLGGWISQQKIRTHEETADPRMTFGQLHPRLTFGKKEQCDNHTIEHKNSHPDPNTNQNIEMQHQSTNGWAVDCNWLGIQRRSMWLLSANPHDSTAKQREEKSSNSCSFWERQWNFVVWYSAGSAMGRWRFSHGQANGSLMKDCTKRWWDGSGAKSL